MFILDWFLSHGHVFYIFGLVFFQQLWWGGLPYCSRYLGLLFGRSIADNPVTEAKQLTTLNYLSWSIQW
jgi:hypothetical protein